MRAVVFEGPADDASRTRVADVAVPEPGPGEIAVDVRVAGINFKDVMARRGDPGYAPSWPFVPGHAVAGTVRALGPGAGPGGDGGLEVGDRVTAMTGSGGLAEVAVAPVSAAVPTPTALDDVRAAAAPGALVTAWLLVHEVGRLRAGESVLVHSAAGGVGSAVAALARAAGAGRLVGTVGGPDRVEGARRAGYDAVVERSVDLVPVLRAILDDGVDLVLDPQGTTLLEADLALVGPGGRIVLFGNAGGGAPDPLPAFGRLMGANVTLSGFSLTALGRDAPHRLRAALRAVLDELASGRLPLEPSVSCGLDTAAEAQESLRRGTADGTSVVALS